MSFYPPFTRHILFLMGRMVAEVVFMLLALLLSFVVGFALIGLAESYPPDQYPGSVSVHGTAPLVRVVEVI